MTGLHTVCDISCSQCSTVIGWKYEVAFEESQKYKEGKFIIEKVRIIKVRIIWFVLNRAASYTSCGFSAFLENIEMAVFVKFNFPAPHFLLLQEGSW